jgi:hypothetical protein
MAARSQSARSSGAESNRAFAAGRYVKRSCRASNESTVEDAAALLDRGLDGGEVVVGQHHAGGLLGNLGASTPHCHADVGTSERGSVVDAVARHRDHMSAALQGAYEPELLLG